MALKCHRGARAVPLHKYHAPLHLQLHSPTDLYCLLRKPFARHASVLPSLSETCLPLSSLLPCPSPLLRTQTPCPLCNIEQHRHREHQNAAHNTPWLAFTHQEALPCSWARFGCQHPGLHLGCQRPYLRMNKNRRWHGGYPLF